MRPSWDDTWVEVALAVANRSLCSRAKVGAVIVSADNRILATGYNGPPAALGHDSECIGWCDRAKDGPSIGSMMSYTDCPSIHAEQNALNFCDRVTREGGTIYITGDVCWTCGKNISNSGLSRVVVMRADDLDRSYREPDDSYRIMRKSGLEVVLL